MALPSSFRERLQHLEATRSQRLHLLQTEKEVQAHKSLVLASKLAAVRSAEQRCLMLHQKIASQHLKTSYLKSEIASLDVKYQKRAHELRDLRSEVEELEDLEKEKERYYGLKSFEMEEFMCKVGNVVAECRERVQELRNGVNELKSTFLELQGNCGYSSDNAIAAAEMRKSELSAIKENLDLCLASNYQVRAQLQKQLQSILTVQLQEKRKVSRSPEYHGHK